MCLLIVARCGCSDAQTERTPSEAEAGPAYRSPFDLAFSPDGQHLAVSDRTACMVLLMNASSNGPAVEVPLGGEVNGVAWSANGRTVYTAGGTAGTVAAIDPSGHLRTRLKVGPRPMGLAIAPRRGLLLVADAATAEVHALDLATGRPRARVPVLREPYFLAVTSDERVAVVGNRLPQGDASDPAVSAAVSLIDLETLQPAAHVSLPPNSMNVLGVAVSPDGRWAYVAHNLARATLPTTQIEYGWINANAITIIDLPEALRHATVLLDRPYGGAANPWGVAVSPDGSTLWVTLSGVHALGRLDLRRLHRLLARRLPPGAESDAPAPAAQPLGEGPVDAYVAGGQSEAGADPTSVELVVSDRPAAYGMGVYLPGVWHSVRLPGNGPRGVAVRPDGSQLVVAMYFSGDIALVDAADGRLLRTIALGPQPREDAARRGEVIFHDAMYCYQHWMSCATCHPDGRTDGLNWDLMNDGTGNPKNTRSLVLSHQTPPAMSLGVRADMAAAAEAGFRFILFREPGAAALKDVKAYIRSLRPEPSPHLSGGRPSRTAERGKAVFESRRTGCIRCHPPPLFTDLKAYDVGTHAETDYQRETIFDTPTLREAWRTGPYLHHGKAATLREVLTVFNEGDRHGRTSHLSAADLDALVAYLESL
jgi:DNA-binding beta-propeller fold protein YncE